MTARCQCGGTLERHFVEYATVDYDCMARCDKCGSIFYPWYVAYCVFEWGGVVSDPLDHIEKAEKFVDESSSGCEYSGIVGFYTLAEATDYKQNGRSL